MKKTGRWALRALAAGTTAVALTAALTTQAGAATTWTIYQKSTSLIQIADVAVAPAGSTWGAGYRRISTGYGFAPVVQRWVDGTFRTITMPSNWQLQLSTIDAASPSNVWAFGNRDSTHLAAWWNGSSWRGFTLPGTGYVSDAKVLSVGDVWAVADNSTTVRRWNGTAWSARALPIRAAAIDATSSSNVWAAGYRTDAQGHEQPAAARWNGSSWADVSPPEIALPAGDEATAHFHDLTMISATNVWAVGAVEWIDTAGKDHVKPLLAHYSSGRWTTWVTAEAPRYRFVTHDGHGGIHIVQGDQNPTVLHGRNSVWTRLALPRTTGQEARASGMARNPVTGTLWTSGFFQPAGGADGPSTAIYWRRLAD